MPVRCAPPESGREVVSRWKKFKAYGLVSVRRENQTLFYSLSDEPEVKVLRKVGIDGIETG